MSTMYARSEPTEQLDLHPTPFTNRAIALFIESLVMGFIGALLVDVTLAIAGGNHSFFNGDNPYREAATLTVTSVLWLWMRVHCEMRGKASFGKKVCSIKPAYLGSGPTVGRVLVRNIWLVVHLVLMVVVWIAGLTGSWGLLESASSMSLLMVVAVTCLFDQRNRSFADRWAVVEFVRA